MNNVNSLTDLFLVPDETLQTVAKKIVSTFPETGDKRKTAFSLKDVTKAIANFQVAATNALAGDTTSLAIRDLAKEALISVLHAISDKETIDEKLKISLS